MKNKFIFSIAMVGIFLGCASKGIVTGGDKDITPPELFHVKPAQESTNVQPKTIRFEFNENIKLKNIWQNLLISPVLKERPTINEFNNGFELVFENDLEENTTYLLNFGNAITDINEGNELTGFTYVFSTGDKIDNGIVSGKVIDATNESLENNENLWALLYKNLADSAVKKLQPEYVTKVSEDGEFKFRNISPNEYNLFIVKDNNSNYYYDLPNEKVAFIKNTVTVADSTEIILDEPIVLFEEVDTINFVQKKERNNNSFTISSRLPIDSLTINDSLNILETYPKATIEKDSVLYFIPENAPANKLYIKSKNEQLDTFSIRAFEPNLVDSILKHEILNETYDSRKKVSIKFNQPIKEISQSLENILLEDSLYIAGGINLQKSSKDSRIVSLNYDWENNKIYDIEFPEGYFTSIYGLKNDTIKLEYKIPHQDEFATIIAKLEKGEINHNLIIELQKDKKTIQTNQISEDQTELVYENLVPGNYTFKVTYDENNNGSWDTGNLLEKKQPEKIIWFPKAIKAMRNWEVEAQLDLE